MTTGRTLPPRAVAGLRVLRRRLIQALWVTLFVSTLSFAIVQSLPGDMAFRIAAGRYGYDQVTAATADALRAELGLDRPAWQQLVSWWGDLARLDLGASTVTGRPVTEELALFLSSTLQLTFVALAMSVTLGVVLGVASVLRRGRLLDRLATVWISATRATPPFLLGLLLIVVFSVHLGWLPATGHGQARNLILPAGTLAIGLSGLFTRITRDVVGRIQDSDHVGFAATKGLPVRSLLSRHVARNASVTLLAYIGVQALILIEGVLVVELVFAWPGLGHALVHAVFWRDVPMLQATTLALGLLVVALNTAVDLASLALDPRPRTREVVGR
ncbi:ABC transporter permease [Nitriliruptor alkaliphilus]|uniref:ABC transporter permease n=1 Tax=Nitriliruptor alkaliphilus TaxID=427918 RepID=UPI000696C1D9|nr:ABC transporter permease [Nitriliruptor alkaliphilus]